ncbi:MAG: hypothetical protein WAW17_07070 [Rhodococcus sp. (in: high G+C Gram-positive bacteria)]|uniref:hypothetical protein n=1 Tax=Rhodococcus sp. TaxID=1831 RepID=UPI003BB107C2
MAKVQTMMWSMRLYISSPQGTSMNLARNLERVARLYHRGVLDDASTVWINSDVRAPVFWTLSSRPTCILWVSAPSSGTVRLTKDRIRWAATYNATTRSPDVDVQLDSIPVDSMKHVTVVVDHGHPTEPVQVIDGTDSVKVTDGFHQGADAAVLDLNNFVPCTRNATPASATYATSLAFVHGMNLLTKGMSRSQAADFEENIERHGIDLAPEMLAKLVEAVTTFDVTAGLLVEEMTSRSGQLPGTS